MGRDGRNLRILVPGEDPSPRNGAPVVSPGLLAADGKPVGPATVNPVDVAVQLVRQYLALPDFGEHAAKVRAEHDRMVEAGETMTAGHVTTMEALEWAAGAQAGARLIKARHEERMAPAEGGDDEPS